MRKMSKDFERYCNLMYAAGGHMWTSLNNGTAMYLYEGEVYYEGRDCFKDAKYGYLYFITRNDDGQMVANKAGKNYKQIGHELSLNLAIYLLRRADEEVYNVVPVERGFRIFTPIGTYHYHDGNFYENREIIDRLCVAFEEDLKKYPLFVDNVEFQNIEHHG
jgi:hypothetical protein